MTDYYGPLGKSILRRLLSVLPAGYQRLLKGSVFSVGGRRYDPILKDFVRGQYIRGKGDIVIYGFNKREIERMEFVDIVYYEIGHKVFQEVLSKKDRARWARARTARFPIKLDDVYLKEELWEEEYCIVFSLMMAAKFYKKENMGREAGKIERGLRKLKKESKAINQLLREDTLVSKKRPSQGDYPQKIHVRVLKWIAGQ